MFIVLAFKDVGCSSFHPFSCVRLAGKPFCLFKCLILSLLAHLELFPFLPLCLKAWTLSHLPCVLSAAACVVIGWHQTTFSPSPLGAWPVPVALAEFALQTCRGNARRHLRHNFSLTAQPLPPCRTLNYTVSILNAHMCACLGV